MDVVDRKQARRIMDFDTGECDSIGRHIMICDMRGMNVNGLAVVSYAGRSKSGAHSWQCHCTYCSGSVKRTAHALLHGNVHGCGCWKGKLNALPKGEAALNSAFLEYVQAAAARGIPWGLTREQFMEKTQEPCRYCGEVGSRTWGAGKQQYNGTYVGNGIDRLCNDDGYFPNNTAGCCKRCNRAKGTMDEGEFIMMCATIYQRFKAEVLA